MFTMRCSTHNIEYEGLGCPACRAEEIRHQESIEAQQQIHTEQLEQQRRQAEALERMHEEEMERAWEQQATLNAIAAAQERRLVEERESRRADEIRSFLRAGLPEFSAEFQVHWRRLNQDMEKVQISENSFEAEYKELDASLSKSKQARESITSTVKVRVRAEFDKYFRSADERQLAQLKTSQLNYQEVVHAVAEPFAAVMDSPYMGSPRLASRRLSDLPSHPAALILRLEHLVRVVNMIQPAQKVGAGFYVPLWILSYMVLGIIFASISEDLLFLAILLSIPATIIIGVQVKSRRAQEELLAEAFLRKCAMLASALLSASANPGMGSYQRGESKVDATSDMISLRNAANANLSEACRRLYIGLFEEYARSRADQQPEHHEVTKLDSEIAQKSDKLNELSREFEKTSATRNSIRRRFGIARKVILGVGREIIEGLRVPGTGLQLVTCSSCSELVLSEVTHCPFCGVRVQAITT